jgi:outer membrane protein OmpA-like peptidoglycan-associated protein
MKTLRLLTFLLAFPLMSFSQEKWQGGVFLGYSNYLGDLVEPRFTLEEAGAAFGILIRHNITNTFGLRMNLFYGSLKGDDGNYTRNLARGASFSTSILEATLMGEYELLGNRRWTQEGKFKKIWSPYIFLGAGVNFVNPDVDWGNIPASNSGRKKDESNDLNNHWTIPIGGGLKFDLSRKMNLALEGGLRISPFTDYLDGIRYAGNPDQNDHYVFGGVVLGFILGDRDADKDGVSDDMDKCPTQAGPAALGGCPDADGDGLADRDDGCPNEPGEHRLNGCPDRDGDGVADKMDDCPDQAGLRRFAGCPDTDNDGIIDKEDNCPTVAGIPAMNGCPDSDRDGITDVDDECPTEPGTAEHRGCPDTDNDGISDKNDKCMDKPGLARFNGCPDSDGDGIDDSDDKCPLAAGPRSKDGCPDVKPEDKAALDLAMRNVQFETNSSRLLPSSIVVLNQIAEIMGRYPGYSLHIDGYTDNVGNDAVNQELSQSRAGACYQFLLAKGISKSLLSFKGHGETKPIADNSTADGRAKNRRVEFTLRPKDN